MFWFIGIDAVHGYVPNNGDLLVIVTNMAVSGFCELTFLNVSLLMIYFGEK